jgi:hypothetical protein
MACKLVQLTDLGSGEVIQNVIAEQKGLADKLKDLD